MQVFGVLTTPTILAPYTCTITHFLGGHNFLATQGVGSRHMTALWAVLQIGMMPVAACGQAHNSFHGV